MALHVDESVRLYRVTQERFLSLVDLGPEPRVVVHRDPSPDGWRAVTTHTDGTLAALHLTVAPLDVAALLAGLPEA
jgi:hypothetical protein